MNTIESNTNDNKQKRGFPWPALLHLIKIKMNIKILNTQPFVVYKKAMGLASTDPSLHKDHILFTYPDGESDIIFNHIDHVILKKPSKSEIIDELLVNDDLRSLALDGQHISIQDSMSDYLTYCNSYS